MAGASGIPVPATVVAQVARDLRNGLFGLSAGLELLAEGRGALVPGDLELGSVRAPLLRILRLIGDLEELGAPISRRVELVTVELVLAYVARECRRRFVRHPSTVAVEIDPMVDKFPLSASGISAALLRVLQHVHESAPGASHIKLHASLAQVGTCSALRVFVCGRPVQAEAPASRRGVGSAARGLSLVIARRYVEGLGGEIYSTEPGGGASAVTLVIPEQRESDAEPEDSHRG